MDVKDFVEEIFVAES